MGTWKCCTLPTIFGLVCFTPHIMFYVIDPQNWPMPSSWVSPPASKEPSLYSPHKNMGSTVFTQMRSATPVYWCFISKLDEIFWNVSWGLKFLFLGVLSPPVCREDEDTISWAQGHSPQMSFHHSLSWLHMNRQAFVKLRGEGCWNILDFSIKQHIIPRITFHFSCLYLVLSINWSPQTQVDRYGPPGPVGFVWGVLAKTWF